MIADNKATRRRTLQLGALVALSTFLEPHAMGGPIEELLPGNWYEIPRSAMMAVAPNPPPPGIEGPLAVFKLASGGAFDTKRDRLIVWGGGTAGYSGNEVYAFDLNTLAWERVTEPSRDVGGYEKSGYYPDGKPRSRHTYDYIEYIPPPVDRFCSFGASTMYPAALPPVGNVDCLNFESRLWERKANAIVYGIGAFSAYDPVTGRVWVHGAGGSYLASFDPRKNQWYPHGRLAIEERGIFFEPTAEIDPVRRKMVAIGDGTVLVWDLAQSGMIRAKELVTTGDTGILFSKSPGLAYDPVIKKFVAWSGGGDVFELDLDEARWSKHSPGPGNKVVPGPPTKRGTFGRFRYVPSKNVYVVVSDINENVFIYRHMKGPSKQRLQ
jgi:hypothetical protein